MAVGYQHFLELHQNEYTFRRFATWLGDVASGPSACGLLTRRDAPSAQALARPWLAASEPVNPRNGADTCIAALWVLRQRRMVAAAGVSMCWPRMREAVQGDTIDVETALAETRTSLDEAAAQDIAALERSIALARHKTATKDQVRRASKGRGAVGHLRSRVWRGRHSQPVSRLAQDDVG